MSATMRFLRLLWIDVRRIHGYVPVALCLGLAWFDRYGMYREGIELWADADRRLFSTVIFLTAIGGGYGAWTASRIRRRRLEAQEITLPAPSGRVIVVTLVAAACWMTVAYLLVAAWHYWPPLREATWDGPNLALAIPVLSATWLAVGLGGVLGSLHRSLLIPPLVTGGIFGLQIWGQVDAWKIASLRLIPMRYLEEHRWGNEIDGFRPHNLAAYSALMVTGAGLAFAAVLLVRRASALRIALTIATVAIALPAGRQVLASHPFDDLRIDPSPVARVCEIAPVSGIEVCLHPAFARLRAEFVALVDATYAPVAGLAGVPTRIWQQSGSSVDQTDDGTYEVLLYDANLEHMTYQLIFALFPDRTDGQRAWDGPDPVQCVIVTWLTPPGAQPYMGCDADLGWLGAAPDIAFDIAAREAELRRVPAIAARFAALPAAEQRAWLEANWGALRAGELTLEDLP